MARDKSAKRPASILSPESSERRTRLLEDGGVRMDSVFNLGNQTCVGPSFVFVATPPSSYHSPCFDLDSVLIRQPRPQPGPWTSAKFRSWPAPLPNWVSWLDRVEQAYGDACKHLDIFECIQLSRRTIPMEKGLILAAATFWCRSSNAFLFRCGPMAPTLLDVCALTSLPVLGAEVSPNLPKLPSDIKFDPKTADSVSYLLWIGTHMQEALLLLKNMWLSFIVGFVATFSVPLLCKLPVNTSR